jgi:hypothetical protein
MELRRLGWICILFVLVPMMARALWQAQQVQGTPRNVPDFLNRLPDENDQAVMRQQNPNQPNYESLNALRKKEVADETAKLVKLANELKADVDRTDRDTLSVSAVKKAEQIEKLAKSLKNKMTVAVGGVQ